MLFCPGPGLLLYGWWHFKVAPWIHWLVRLELSLCDLTRGTACQSLWTVPEYVCTKLRKLLMGRDFEPKSSRILLFPIVSFNSLNFPIPYDLISSWASCPLVHKRAIYESADDTLHVLQFKLLSGKPSYTDFSRVNMATQGTFIVPPTFGSMGDYSDLPQYRIGSTAQLAWSLPYTNQDTGLWLLQDGDSLFCEKLYLAKTSCALLLGERKAFQRCLPYQRLSANSVF